MTHPKDGSPISYEFFREISNLEQFGALAQPLIDCLNHSFQDSVPAAEAALSIRGSLVIVAMTVAREVAGYATLHKRTVADLIRHTTEDMDPSAAVYYFGSIIIDREFQSQGIYPNFNRMMFEEVVANKVPYINLTTQNPKIERGMQKSLAALMAENKIIGYSMDRVVVPGLYGRQLTSYDLDVAGTPFEQLNHKQGDAFSLLYELTYE
jgi:hypothetical protein